MTEDPQDRGYRQTRLLGQWQLQSAGPLDPGGKGQGTAEQQRCNKQAILLGGQHCGNQVTNAASMATRRD